MSLYQEFMFSVLRPELQNVEILVQEFTNDSLKVASSYPITVWLNISVDLLVCFAKFCSSHFPQRLSLTWRNEIWFLFSN